MERDYMNVTRNSKYSKTNWLHIIADLKKKLDHKEFERTGILRKNLHCKSQGHKNPFTT